MANFFLCACIFRVALPILILTCALFRPTILSAIYLLLLLWSPLLSVPTEKSMAGATGIYLKILLAISILCFLLQLAFQIVLLAMPPYGHFLVKCKMPETILTYCGFVRLDSAKGVTITTWIAPEIVMLITAFLTFTLCTKLTAPSSELTTEEGEHQIKVKQKRSFGFWVSVAKYIGLISLCVAAVLRPSVPGAFYFLVFIGSCTWWACYRELEKAFAIICRIVMVVVFLHIACLYAYQFEWTQEKVNVSSPYIKYLGIEPLYNTSCEDPREIVWMPIQWDSYINPLALIWLFYVLAIVSRNMLKPKIHPRDSDSTMNERTPLMRGVSPSRRYGVGAKLSGSNVTQDSIGSVTVTENLTDIPLHDLAEEEEEKPGCFDHAVFIVESLIQFIIQSSYVVTNIIMMTWSITYHSWLTFVLLLWANILWMIPNQRRSMLRSSPVLVCYAIFLLLSAYVYSMDIDELPSTIYGISMEQIGFNKVREFPCNPLMVKCLFTVMFWITMRQHMKEIREARHSTTLAEMAAPLQVSVTAATGVSKEQAAQETQILQSIGQYLKKFLSRVWIWIVAITLFAVAITGERMTAFRIFYMALFLFFIITFQLSFKLWKKVMFGFWLTVIIYSMTILILVYTYQFHDFDNYWYKYLHIPKELQLDIGLEKYNPAQLFIRLATPTFFVIVTVVQLHYFHNDFILYSTPTAQPVLINPTSEEASSVQGKVLEQNKETDEDGTDTSDITSLKIDLTDIGNVSGKQVLYKFHELVQRLQLVINFMFLFLEIHMHKLVLVLAMLMCIYDQCALYCIVVLFGVIGLTSGRKMHLFVIYFCSVFVSCLLLARMVYQIQYIKHDHWNASCPVNSTYNVSMNSAEWLGFNKTVTGRNLPRLVQWNIGYILGVTLYTVVLVRQFNHKLRLGQPTARLFFMFPGITNKDRHKNLINALKYMCNYGFYRFGVEISLMATVALIGFRMDVYSMIYAAWLCLLFALKRSVLSKIWNFYMCFIAVFIPIQYVMIVGLPPIECIDFPWNRSRMLRELQEWAFLMDYQYPPVAQKLVLDVILLLFVARQAVVFRLESNYKDQDYPGGSNESIIHNAEVKDFENPAPDFITFARSYLDVINRIIYLGWMWLTLAIVFLAGANRVNLFSIGYLVGSFVFLWQGSDIYLKPIPRILRLWNCLLGYNVFVMFSKTILQMVACVFIINIANNCWVVQLLGIGCVRKFAINSKEIPEKPCEVPKDYIGLVWDGICFGFLIIQRRIFCSYSFFHVIDETKATTILASRGAELIEQLRQKRMHDQDEQERRILEKIKAKMDRIKATQQKMQGPFTSTNNHYVDQPPLARSSSVSSCASATSQQTPEAGYHTPIDEDEPAPLTPAAGSLIQPQAPSPFSAIMTVSLEGYLEPQRMSFSSPPNSELNPRPPSPDDSYPVFSPPPYDAAPPYAEVVNIPQVAPQRQHSIGPPWMNGALITPRQSIISYSSRSPLSHHTYGIFPKSSRPLYRKWQPKTYKQAVRSGDYYMFDDLDDDEDLEMIEELQPEREEMEDEEMAAQARKRTLGELLSTALKTDIGTTIRTASDRELRRASMPRLGRQKSIVSGRSQYSAPLSAPPIVEESQTRLDSSPSSKGKKAKIDVIEPVPGTSKEEELSEIAEPKDSKFQKIIDILLFIWAFIDSALVSLTNYLNKYSRDYRYVIKVLGKEKKQLKQTTDYTEGIRMGLGQKWQPASSYRSLLHRSQDASVADLTPTIGTYSPSDSYRLTLMRAIETARRNSANNSNSTTVQSAISDEKRPSSESSESKAQEAGSPLPYSPEKDSSQMHIIHHKLDDDFDPGELSSYDQPTIIRFFLAIWYIILSHSDILCYFAIFLNQVRSATFLSLPLPLMVFFWGTLTVPRPSKNFWITIIAYTQMIVLIKCIFQFEFLPWNETTLQVSAINPAKIFGVERRSQYAAYDLILLLIVYFHRYMLKCLGLWKTTVLVVPVFSDGPHMVDEADVNPLKRADGNSPLALDDIDQQSTRTNNVRRGSDLERLVEENEQDEEHDADTETMAEYRVDNVFNVTVKNKTVYDMFPDTLKLAPAKYFQAIKNFFVQLKDPSFRVTVDVYSYMFMCDFFNFFVILVGYSSFGTQQGDGGVSSYLEDNRVPLLFLLMLILQFMLIIVDRAIFLRKHISAKIIFQFVQIIVLHIWLFILFPIVTERTFISVIPPQMYYMVKCFYLLLSAYQIRCGYPSRILGNVLCKGYNYINMFLFKGFMMVPFLFELRTVMDWMWTDTSMTIFDWIKMEDIFAHVFQLKEFTPPEFLQRISDNARDKEKCTRHVEDEYPQPRGEKKSPNVKYLTGGVCLFIIIAIIWFPLVFFSLGNAVGEPNPPVDVTLDVRIGPYEPVYHLSAQANAIYQFDESDLTALITTYKRNKYVVDFINNYEHRDIVAIKLSQDSANLWSISPPDRKRMIDEVNSTSPISIRLQYIITHKSNQDASVIRDENVHIMPATVNGEPNSERQKLLEMLNSNVSIDPIQIGYILPKFLKVTNRATAKPVPHMMDPVDGAPEAVELRRLTLKLMRDVMNSELEWWEIQEDCNDTNYNKYLSELPYQDCSSIMMYAFNDKIFPEALGLITGGGIIGLYTTFVFLASRVLRGFFGDICFKIMFEDMPNIDRVLQLCLDIYLVREAREFCLEEDLFAKLVFLFRSPETLIKWTRPKEELGDDEDPEGVPE